MKALILVNRSAGEGKQRITPELLENLFRERGIEAQAHWLENDSTRNMPEMLRGFDTVVAAGGDGTVSGIAGLLACSRFRLGVLPVGTLNHFAKDLGIPLELGKAIECVVGGHVTRVDVGEVNGHIFINNASLGAYPRMVQTRKRQQANFGLGKWPAALIATWQMLSHCPLLRATLQIDNRRLERTTPFVFVGNNRYAMDLLSIGARISMEEGLLSLYTAHCSSGWGLVRLAGHALLNRLDQVADFDALLGTHLEVVLRGTDRARVAIDGELRLMRTPLLYRIRPAALRVITPA